VATTGVQDSGCRRAKTERAREPSRPIANRMRDTLARLAIAHAKQPAT
jgi:hypothetical protein